MDRRTRPIPAGAAVRHPIRHPAAALHLLVAYLPREAGAVVAGHHPEGVVAGAVVAFPQEGAEARSHSWARH